MASIDFSERNWRVGPPTMGVSGSLYDLVRRYLAGHDGSCTRQELKAAILANPNAADRFARGKGLTPLLNNMKHSGDIVLEGDTVRASRRTWRRLGLNAPA